MKNDIQSCLEVAQKIDGLEQDVTSWEADYLDSILKRLRSGVKLTEKQFQVLEGMAEKYLPEEDR